MTEKIPCEDCDKQLSVEVIDTRDPQAFVPGFVRSKIAEAQRRGAEYLMIVCDTFEDYAAFGFDPKTAKDLPECDYPVYCNDEAALKQEYDRLEGKNMQRVQAIYQV